MVFAEELFLFGGQIHLEASLGAVQGARERRALVGQPRWESAEFGTEPFEPWYAPG